jgi:hypothetical protein
MKESKIKIPNQLFFELVGKQKQKGLNKYGHSLDDCPVEKFDWITMMLEELVDYHQYIQKFREARETMHLRIKAQDGKYIVKFGDFEVCRLDDFDDANDFVESLKAL